MKNSNPLRRWFLRHQSITGSLTGLTAGVLLGALTPSLPLFMLAPLIAGFVAGLLRGSGAKAGILTLLFPMATVTMVSLAMPNFDWTVPEMPVFTGIGIVNATFAALSNGIVRSTWAVFHGLAGMFAALGGILAIITLVLIPIIMAVELVATIVLGAVGGLIGGFMRKNLFAPPT